jgi:alpha-galactosidase
MGWNSWDSYGLTVTEQEYLDNAAVMAAQLRKAGWQYALVDEGWYLPNPEAKPEEFQFNLDKAGRYIPVDNRFPSAANGAGFTALAGKIHAQGLKFGIHIIRGIPKQAVAKNLPIADSSFTAADAADTTDTCPWNGDNYGVKNNPAGQAYYDSVAKLYASWGVDYIKVDCISSHPYKSDEIQMVSEAIGKSGRKMVLSLSPGPTPVAKAAEVSKWADMWRISDDMWDIWKTESGKAFPQDLTGQFQKAAAWAEHSGDGRWPDADMLPIGYLGPRPGNGKARNSDLKPEEQKTLLTLWCIFRSPLIMGGNLTKLDENTSALLTNAEVLAVDQHSTGGKQVTAGDNAVLWRAEDGKGGHYLALFNLGEETRTLEWTWKQAGLTGTSYQLRDLWLHKDLGTAEKLKMAVRRHGAVLLRVEGQ